ncbi:MAG: hypothetical protein H0W40_03415 [Methylibium sp.]|uniref:FHA domain-containing protein n=1 Tax=Methylibium sp. TaxID=2067992 RepID=UPI0017CA6EB5|nr:FHA domain-containing protein [Methylibium sp.]MBA3596413.1 hypothetical protein [Methylibium sp.]
MNTQTFGGMAAAQRAQQTFANLLQSPILNAGAAVPRLHPCAVRVSAGLHRGAALRLRSAARVGSADDNDIVLRDAGVRPHHAELRRVDGVWSLFALPGGLALPPSESGIRGRFMRQRLVIGSAELVLTQALPPEPAPKRLRRSLGRGVAPVLLALSALLTAGVVVQLVRPASASMPLDTRNLAAQGWPDVNLVAAPDSSPLATGYVDDAASLARLRLWLEQEKLAHAGLQVRVGSELAMQVRDALADPSLSVAYRGAGTVRVQGTSDDMAVRDRLRLLTADLAGVVRIDDRVAFYQVPNTAPRQHALPVQIVSVVPGENGNFAGADGARYFVGAVLPDGAEVIAIGPEAIEFAVGKNRITYPLN